MIMRKIIPFLVLLIILLSTFLLGSRMIISGDFFFLADQARDILLVQDIVNVYHFALIGTHSGLGGFFHGPLWLYLLVPFYIVGRGNPFIFTYAYILVALITVLAGFIAGYSLYGKKVGILFAFFLAISPSIWSYIPNTIGVNMLPLVFVLIFYFLIRYIRGESWAYIFAIFFVGLSLQFETALPLILIPIVGSSFFLNKKIFHQPKIIVLSILSFILSISTFILFEVRHDFLMTHSLIGLFTSNKHQQGYLNLSERVVSHFHSLIKVYESILITHSIFLEIALMLLFLVFLYLSFVKRDFVKKERKELIYFLVFPIVIFVLYLFYGYTLWPEYLLGLVVPVALALSLIIMKVWNEKLGKFFVLLFFVLTFFDVGKVLYTQYFLSYQQNTTAGSYLNQKKVADWVFHDAKRQPFGYFVYTPETFTYGMDYLMKYEGKQHGNIPISKKERITYLIMYPPLDNDLHAHDFWKENVIHTRAPVIGRKEFPGGIIVEKLSIKNEEKSVDPNYYQDLIFR